MTVIGDTGTGKTTLIARILAERKYVLSVRTKSDKTPLPGKHVRTAAAFKRLDIGRDGRVLLDPAYERQAYEIYHAFETVWREDGWTVNIDELYYLTSQLGAASRVIERQINRFLTQGRSKGISVVSGQCQRRGSLCRNLRTLSRSGLRGVTGKRSRTRAATIGRRRFSDSDGTNSPGTTGQSARSG